MTKINFGGVEEEVVTREEFPLERAREVLKDEVVAVLGYGVQGPAQALNMRDNGIRVIVGQRKGTKNWQKAVEDGWVPGETLFPVEEAAEKGHHGYVPDLQKIRSAGRRCMVATAFSASAASCACVRGTRFGRPVEPEEYW